MTTWAGAHTGSLPGPAAPRAWMNPTFPGQLLPIPRSASQVCTNLHCWMGRGHGPRDVQTSRGKV